MADVPEKFLKPYNPGETEGPIYKKWEESGYFNPDNLPPIDAAQGKSERTEAFTIIMPPPNVTGILHMGHGLMLSVEDALVRYKRMRGFRTLWLPGTDHAAIATQSVVEKKVSKEEKKSRHDLGREELLRRIEDFATTSHDAILSQIKTLGASCDWSREAFTLDEQRSLAVRTMFKKMYDDGLIYRKNRIVNWDPKGQTTISDDEIVYEERPAKLYTFKYSKDFPIPIATTRPETKVGDTAVAVHPDDARYREFVGKTYELMFCDVPLSITVVADKEVDPEFGTGAVGITPAHSMTDWEIAERHDLPVKQVINEYAKMTVEGRLSGLKTAEARERVVEWLKEESLLTEEKDMSHSVATAERTGGVIEPLPKLQWFIDVHKEIPGRGKTLKDLMREPVEKNEITILPDHFGKIYFHWIDNLRDWCISRQIWYGHRIPVWYEKVESEKSKVESADRKLNVGEPPADIENWEQDPDTLDTWFSSGLWTFSTLGWPEETRDLKTFHPTDVLETGYEILFFWVARMILMTEYALGTIPFRTVYLHGTVRDAKGRKMSKSLGNGIDPIDIAQKYGADAGRMALLVGNTPGTDLALSEDKIKAYKLFANKIWNIARFLLENDVFASHKAALSAEDEEVRKTFDELAKNITDDLEQYRLHLATEKIYHYLWDTFASVMLEESKGVLKGGDEALRTSRAALLSGIFTDCLKLLHPFMPFVTEEIWESVRREDEPELLMVAKWPVH